MEVEAAQGQEERIIQQVRAMEVRRQRLQIVLQLVQRLPSLAGAECLHTMMPTRKYFLLIFFLLPPHWHRRPGGPSCWHILTLAPSVDNKALEGLEVRSSSMTKPRAVASKIMLVSVSDIRRTLMPISARLPTTTITAANLPRLLQLTAECNPRSMSQ